jgi:type VI secretion system protein ImpA
MDIPTLLAAVSPHSPCGPNLEYDREFMEAEQAAREVPEQQFGATVVPAQEPDWEKVKERSLVLFARTKDLRIAVLLMRALTRTQGMPGLAAGLQLIQGLLERYWDSVHPTPDPDEPDDLTMRLNALAPLIHSAALLQDLRDVFLVRPGPHGAVSVRDILIALNKLPAPGGMPEGQVESVKGILRAAANENAPSIAAVRQSRQTVHTLHGFLVEKVGIERALDLRPLHELLDALAQVCEDEVNTAEAMGMAEVEKNVGPDPAVLRVSSDIGPIRTREDAIRILDKVCQFLEATEPANPAPLFIRRAQKLMTKNFAEIIQELAPDSWSEIVKMTGAE